MRKIKIEAIGKVGESPEAKIEMEGLADLETPDWLFVCAKCGDHDRSKGSPELNFREKKIFYLCRGCGYMNEMYFGTPSPQPLPRTRFR